MLICTMLMIEMIMTMITKIIMITMISKRKKKRGVGEGSFFLTAISLCQIEKQLKLDQRTAHICRFLVKVTRISVSRCTRLK